MKTIKLLFFLSSFTFSFSFCHGQSWDWAKRGTSLSDTWGIATDANGDAYLTGYFIDSITFGSKHLSSPNINSYLIKYDSMGNILWAAQSKSASNISAAATIYAATDNYGNAYITGNLNDTVTFGSFTLKSFYDVNYSGIFLTKYNASGNVLWAKQATVSSPAGFANASSVAASDDSGNVYTAGYFRDTITFGAYMLKSMYPTEVFYLAKYDSGGNTLWAKQATIPSVKSSAIPYSVATDKAGNAYITGFFRDTITLGSFTLTTTSSQGNVFFAKFDLNGNVLWVKQPNIPSTACSGAGYSAATDKMGNAYLTGYFIDTATFGTFTLITPFGDKYGNAEIFLAKYSPSGNVLWVKQSHHSSNEAPWYGNSLSIDEMNEIYLSGGNGGPAAGKVWFGRDTFSYNNASDPSIVLKFDSSGNLLCGSVVTGGGDDFNGIAVNSSGKCIYFGGDIEAALILGKDTLPAYKAGEAPFIARWKPCYSNTATGISETPSQKNSISLFPNPNNGIFEIQATSQQSLANSNVEVYNMLGEKVHSQLFIANYPLSINLSNQPNGVYLYRVVSEDGEWVSEGKFVIAH